MDACQRVKLSEIISQNTTAERIENTRDEHYITLSLYGNGARERIIKDEKYPVPFLGYRVSTGQFIYSRIDARNGAYGIIDASLDGFIVSKDFPVYDIDTRKVLPQFLLRSVLSESFIDQIRHSSFGATNRMRIKEEVFENYSIILPSLDRQQEIVDRLDSVQHTISSRKRGLELLDELVKARFVELCGDPISNTKRLATMPLGKACYLKAGDTTAASDIHERSIEYPIPCYGGNGIRGYVEQATHCGDYPIIGRQGALCGNVQLATGKFHATEHAIVVTPLIEMNVIWGFYLLKYMDLNRYHTGAAQPGLAVKTLNNVNIPIADMTVQNDFATFVKQVNRIKLTIQKSLDKMEVLQKALMQKYFG